MSQATTTPTAATDMAAELGEFLTVQEAASLLRTGEYVIYRAIKGGRIAGVKRIGTRKGLRIPVDSFRDYADSLNVA